MRMADFDALASEAHEILNAATIRHKMDLSTVQGWSQLLEACNSKRFFERVPRHSLDRLKALYLKWTQLYRQLQFEATTRPVWNS